MKAHEWVTLVSCAGHLALATLSILRGSRSPLARALTILCLDFFAFNAADLAGNISTVRGWIWIDVVSASIGPALVLDFILTFVGRRRELRGVLYGVYFYFGGVSLASGLAFVAEWARNFAGGTVWAVLMFVGFLPLSLLLLWLLVQHLRGATTLLERGRTWLVFAAFLVGATGCLTDLFADMGLVIPRLAPLGTLLATLLLAAVVLRFALFERQVSFMLVINALVVGMMQVLAYLAMFRFLRSNQAMLIAGIVTVSLAIVPAIRELGRTQAAQRERLEYLATLGRFSAQMAHDLRNPLAAIKGAAQFLEEERARGSSLSDQGEFLALIHQQASRIDRVIREYQRLGRVEASLEPLAVAELLQGVIAPQTLAAPSGVELRADVADDLPPCRVDRDLLTGALENLVRNAFEAISGAAPDPNDPQNPAQNAGIVTLRAVHLGPADPEHVLISVADTGPGMDPRVRERAFEDFYTTKAQGSGLGLSFVRRVAEAHGGDATLKSQVGRGTTVSLRLRVHR